MAGKKGKNNAQPKANAKVPAQADPSPVVQCRGEAVTATTPGAENKPMEDTGPKDLPKEEPAPEAPPTEDATERAVEEPVETTETPPADEIQPLVETSLPDTPREEENSLEAAPPASAPAPPPPPPPAQTGGWGWGSFKMPDVISGLDVGGLQESVSAFAQAASQKTAELTETAKNQIEVVQSGIAESVQGGILQAEGAQPTGPDSPTMELPASSGSEIAEEMNQYLAKGTSFFQEGFFKLKTEISKVDMEEVKNRTAELGTTAFGVVNEQIAKTKEEANNLMKEFEQFKVDQERDMREQNASPFNNESQWTSPWCLEYVTSRYSKLLTVTDIDIDTLCIVIQYRILTLSTLCTYHDIHAKINPDYAFDPWTVTTAAEILREDPKLDELRYSLVPSKMTEEAFWGAYFSLVDELLERLETDVVAEGITEPEIALARERCVKAAPVVSKSVSSQEEDPKESKVEINDDELNDLLANVDSDLDAESLDEDEIMKLMEASSD